MHAIIHYIGREGNGMGEKGTSFAGGGCGCEEGEGEGVGLRGAREEGRGRRAVDVGVLELRVHSAVQILPEGEEEVVKAEEEEEGQDL